MVNYFMSVFTQIFSGHLGNLELAAASLGNNGIQTFAYGVMVKTFSDLSYTATYSYYKKVLHRLGKGGS